MWSRLGVGIAAATYRRDPARASLWTPSAGAARPRHLRTNTEQTAGFLLRVADARFAFAARAQAPGRDRRRTGPWGGLTRTYRGARIDANEKEAVFGLFLDGHPMHGLTSFGSWENLLPLIDAWLDDRDASPPYSWNRP
jgi:hypothetical protein